MVLGKQSMSAGEKNLQNISVWLPDWASNFLKSKFWKLLETFFDKMVSILINVIQHKQYFFSFWHMFLLSACSCQSQTTSCLSLMSHHQVNNNCNRVKSTVLKMAIMPYVIFYYLMLHVFRSNRHCPWKFHKFRRKTPLLESLFFLKIMKLYKDACSA